jgi:hypothetical protein
MYFTALGTPSPSAQALIDRRAGHFLKINGADSFFDELAQKVAAIETLQSPHPASVQIAVALMKEYLLESRHQIRLHDLLSKEIAHATDKLRSDVFRTDTGAGDTYLVQIERFTSVMSTLMPMAYTAGMWSTPEQAKFWFEATATLAKRILNTGGGYVHLIQLQAFPAMLLMYAFGLGAVVQGQHKLLGGMLGKTVDFGSSNDGQFALGDKLNVISLCEANILKKIPKYENRRFPGPDMIADLLRPIAQLELRDELEFDTAFSKLEMAISFGFAERCSGKYEGWVPTGRFTYLRDVANRLISGWQSGSSQDQQELRLMAALQREPEFDRVRIWMNKQMW